MKANRLPSSIESLPSGLMFSSGSGSSGIAELSLDELPTPIPLIAETL